MKHSGPLKNLKHEQFTQEFISGKNQKEAYKVAYPDVLDNTAKSNGSTLMTRDDVRNRCLEILSKTTGLTLTNQLSNLQTLSQAEKQVAVKGILQAVEDNPTRLEATKTILRLYGLLITNTTPQVDARSVTFNINSQDITKLDNITSRLETLEARKEDRISGKR